MNVGALLFPLKKFAPVRILLLIAIGIAFITRLVLLLSFWHPIAPGFSNILTSFIIGFVYDAVVSILLTTPFLLQIAFTTNYIYTNKGKWITIFFFVVVLSVVGFTSLVPKEFNSDLYHSLIGYLIARFAIFLFLLQRSFSFRLKWRSGVLKLFFFITVFLLVSNAVSEWFFWNEFASRYNFIAVDYLIYTNEVIGNIRESYPLFPIITGVLLLSAAIFYFTSGPIACSVRTPLAFLKRLLFAAIMIAAGLLLARVIPPQWKYFSRNTYVNELAGNGIYDFVQAFKKNELDFYTYYRTLPDTTAFKLVREQLGMPNSRYMPPDLTNLRRSIRDSLPERKMNVALISIESLSASFMQAFGDSSHITPQLDALASRGMFFTRLYASGTRTVRGLEALSLSIPPLPGQSIIKRPDNEGLYNIGAVLKSKGYITQYLYGGFGYFDNMNYFFGHNGYEVLDRKALKPSEIHYANIWGVADEDLFTLALRTMDSDNLKQQPFFIHIMTVSNHRPYTYPAGRINIPPSAHSRQGAVKYTDYAIGNFIKQAAQKPWFKNTLFVIVADHCASSAGRQELPLPGYHIPLIIYAPGIVQPRQVNALMGQIDIAPTILGLLHLNYTSLFYGNDILKTPPQKQRAFISTYQGLGYLKSDTLIVQSPVKKISAYKIDPVTKEQQEIAPPGQLVNEAIAYYQTAAWLIRHRKYRF
ncbi:sulfatase [Niabella ginsenosidivorans]|uniref:Sulfatase n=1 Tax=Niabella ginsenosidivorans TaxID=1176587 RepID=A0A1A9I7Y1_9BACT|nr:LTA synthase family protein [Niabella ginsenosidivorans]ANH82772.1 sulfatase [Niabella ginsenosidivorans]